MKKILLCGMLLLSEGLYAQQRQPVNPALDSLKNEKDTIALNKKIDRLKSGNQKDLSLLLNYYNFNRNQKKAEEVVGIAVHRFPKGELAGIMATNAIYSENDAVKQENMSREFKQNFPTVKTDMIDYAVSYSYANLKNTPKTIEYLAKISDPSFRPGAVGIIAGELMKYDLPTAEKVVKAELAKAKELAEDTAYISNRKKEDVLYNPQKTYYTMLMLYGDMLTKKQDYKSALVYTKEVFDNSPQKTDALNKKYYFLLSKNGQYQEAFPELEKMVASGQSDEATKTELKIAYGKMYPGKNVDQYMASFGSALDKKYQEEAAKLIVKETSPNFTVTDINGKQVSLADFKGKTIVLDFWATWCGPCKASFPAMQRLVNKYKKDDLVKFLFIHTWERSVSPKQDAVTYLKDNNFNMDLYMDVKDKVTKANPAVSAFKVNGIPAKFVIDGAGNIRFKLTGFSGGDDAAVAEVSAMIEMTKK